MFTSLAAHLHGKKYLKKDDIESLLFVLSHTGLGYLPWQTYRATPDGLKKIMNHKYNVQPEELFPHEVFPP